MKRIVLKSGKWIKMSDNTTKMIVEQLNKQSQWVIITEKDTGEVIFVINVDEIRANEFQPRRDFDETALQELAQSIRENGLIQPLIVRRKDDHYELIAG